MKESSGSSGLRTYVLTRLGLALPTVLILLTVVFLLMRVAPGDPITAALGARLPAKELEKRKKEAGYDKPILQQYFEYLGQVVTLDLGGYKRGNLNKLLKPKVIAASTRV